MLKEFRQDHIRIGKYRIRALSFLWFGVRIAQSLFFIVCFYFFYVGLWLLIGIKEKEKKSKDFFFYI